MNRKLIVIIAAVLFVLLAALIIFKISGIRRGTNVSVGSTSIPALLAQAKNLEANNSLLEAKEEYFKLINDYASSGEVMNWQKKVEELNIKLLFSPTITPKSVLYGIKPGDTLNKIAREYKTTIELIMKSNNLADARIVPGHKLKVWNTPFSIYVDKSQNILLLKSGEEVVKTYIVSTGKNNCSPVGTFKVVNKLINPSWFKAGAVVPSDSPENILGTRWMGFDIAGYGIHGTTAPQELGTQVTQGCVRMANPEVEELYTIIPVGTEVTIVD